ncbi:MAG: dihydroorotase, partial [Litorimonas sp.]
IMSALTVTNIRIIDPKSGYDAHGNVAMQDGKIVDFGPDTTVIGQILKGDNLICAPGLIDMRVTTGEPGRENRETLATASQAAIAGGVTSMVIMPETNPVIDDLSLVDFLQRRSENLPVNIHIGAALTKGLDGQSMTEIGLMHDAGAALFSNGPVPITDAQIMRRLLAYSASFGALIANRALTPTLSQDAVAHESDFASRLGLSAAPAISERIMAERDIALAELTGGRLLIDLVSSAQTLDPIRRAKANYLKNIACSVSINHLALNEIDIGDYRSFAKLDPPLREEHDRQALLGAVNDGTIDVIVSDHDPRPAGEKRLPFSEASSGAVGLEILLAAGLSQVADGALDLMAFLAALTCNPAKLLGLPSGRIAKGAPADLVIFAPNQPWVCHSETLKSRSKNTPFDGRRMTGKAVHTIKDGAVVYSA